MNEVRIPRLSFWLLASIAITVLFLGNEPNILIRIQHNWIESLIILVVSFFMNGRFGFVKNAYTARRSISSKKRITLRILGILILILGILIEIFLYSLSKFILIPLIFICAWTAPFLLYFSYDFSKNNQNVSI